MRILDFKLQFQSPSGVWLSSSTPTLKKGVKYRIDPNSELNKRLLKGLTTGFEVTEDLSQEREYRQRAAKLRKSSEILESVDIARILTGAKELTQKIKEAHKALE